MKVLLSVCLFFAPILAAPYAGTFLGDDTPSISGILKFIIHNFRNNRCNELYIKLKYELYIKLKYEIGGDDFNVGPSEVAQEEHAKLEEAAQKALSIIEHAGK